MTDFRGNGSSIVAPFEEDELGTARISRAASYCDTLRHRPHAGAEALEIASPSGAVCPLCTRWVQNNRAFPIGLERSRRASLERSRRASLEYSRRASLQRNRRATLEHSQRTSAEKKRTVPALIAVG